MNKDIQVGEYVRTEDGHIGKLVYKTEYHLTFDNNYVCKYRDEISDFKFIVNHSFNLIDLIEVGDYVNGSKVYDVKKITSKNYEQGWILLSNYDRDAILSKQIKTIVTHEQFKAMEYKIGGEE